MIDLEFLERLIEAIDRSGLDSIELERGGTRVRLSRSPAAAPVASAHSPGVAAPPVAPVPNPAAPPGGPSSAPAQPPPAPARELVDIESPMVGTFYRAPAPDAPPYVEVGSKVKKGDTLCIIEAMKLMNELEAETTGSIVEVCVENAEPVEYGQVLFRVDPS